MPEQDTINEYLGRLSAYRQNLKQLLRQQAEFGGFQYTPLPLLNNISATRAEIGLLKSALRGWGVAVEDDSDDEPQAAEGARSPSRPRWRRPRLARLALALTVCAALALAGLWGVPATRRGVSASLTNQGYKLRSQGQYAEARDTLLRAIWYDPGNGEAFYELAESYRLLGRDDLATDAYEQAIRIAPASGLYHQRYGNLLITLGQPARAAEQLHLALRYSPEDHMAYNELGYLAIQQGDWRQARAYIERGLELDGTVGALHKNMGLVELHDRSFAQAVSRFNRAITLGAGGDAWYGLAQTYVAMGERGRACATIAAAKQALIIQEQRLSDLETTVGCGR